MSRELYKKHRPKKLSEVLGQRAAVSILKPALENGNVPHCLLFTGDSGCGKTTLARITARGLQCNRVDFQEINAADFRGIDTIRDIRNRMGMAPISGPVRVWLIDEAHQLSTAAQDAVLKMLEDTPDHVYFMLATTDPQKLKKTIRTRATEVAVKLLTPRDMYVLMDTILGREGMEVAAIVQAKVVEYAEGSARKALVLLNQVVGMASEEDQLQSIEAADVRPKAIALARALIDPRNKWATVAPLLKDLDDDPETLRRMVLGYASSTLLRGGKHGRAYLLLQAFAEPTYNTGKPGLVAACYEVVEAG